MRGYGMPQASFADDANIDECAKSRRHGAASNTA